MIREDLAVIEYVAAMSCRLLGLGHQVYLGGYGTYRSRQEYASLVNVDVYMCAHANVGAEYCLVVWDGSGEELADKIGAAIVADFPGLARVVTPRSGSVSWPEAFKVLTGAIARNLPGCAIVILEPFSVDILDHASIQTPKALERLGTVIGETIHQWGEQNYGTKET